MFTYVLRVNLQKIYHEILNISVYTLIYFLYVYLYLSHMYPLKRG